MDEFPLLHPCPVLQSPSANFSAPQQTPPAQQEALKLALGLKPVFGPEQGRGLKGLQPWHTVFTQHGPGATEPSVLLHSQFIHKSLGGSVIASPSQESDHPSE